MSIGDCCQTVGNSIDSCFSAVGSGLSTCGGFVSDTCTTIGNSIGSGCSAIGNGISSCCTSFTTCITTFATDTVWPCVQSVLSAISGFFKAIGNWVDSNKEFSIGTGIGCIAGIVVSAVAAWFCWDKNDEMPPAGGKPKDSTIPGNPSSKPDADAVEVEGGEAHGHAHHESSDHGRAGDHPAGHAHAV